MMEFGRYELFPFALAPPNNNNSRALVALLAIWRLSLEEGRKYHIRAADISCNRSKPSSTFSIDPYYYIKKPQLLIYRSAVLNDY
jgi:hypothetical protein